MKILPPLPPEYPPLSEISMSSGTKVQTTGGPNSGTEFKSRSICRKQMFTRAVDTSCDRAACIPADVHRAGQHRPCGRSGYNKASAAPALDFAEPLPALRFIRVPWRPVDRRYPGDSLPASSQFGIGGVVVPGCGGAPIAGLWLSGSGYRLGAGYCRAGLLLDRTALHLQRDGSPGRRNFGGPAGGLAGRHEDSGQEPRSGEGVAPPAEQYGSAL